MERRRLTLARELAHRLIESFSFQDRLQNERAANFFAGAFLVPREHLQRQVGTSRHAIGYSELIKLKREYRVSGAAILIRLRQLETISQRRLEAAFRSFARTWRTQEPSPLEPAIAEGKQEFQARLDQLCFRALAEREISFGKASELLRKTQDQIEGELTGPSLQNEG